MGPLKIKVLLKKPIYSKVFRKNPKKFSGFDANCTMSGGAGVDDGGRSTDRRDVCKIWYGDHLKDVGCGNGEPYVSGQRCAKVEITTC